MPTSPTWPTATASSQPLIEEHGGVDFLINNAGRSIRRAIESSYDRFHDFERTMQLNYFGCLRVIMGFLPGMVRKRKGHVINISSIGVLTNAPRFSAYVAPQGGARRVDALRVERVRRPGHHASPRSTCRWCARR